MNIPSEYASELFRVVVIGASLSLFLIMVGSLMADMMRSMWR